ncbi:hypothetical protein ACQUFY_26645 (plasmid) [Robbsia andropogonis]
MFNAAHQFRAYWIAPANADLLDSVGSKPSSLFAGYQVVACCVQA